MDPSARDHVYGYSATAAAVAGAPSSRPCTVMTSREGVQRPLCLKGTGRETRSQEATADGWEVEGRGCGPLDPLPSH